MRGMWGRETRDVILVVILRWGAHPNWYFGISPSKLCKIWILWQTSPATSVQVNLAPAMIGFFFPVKKNRLLDVPLRFCWFRLYSKVLLPALVALYTESATVCSNNMNHLFCFPSFWLIYTIFHPQSLLPFIIPSHFNVELCLLGSASCERKETSMPSSWPRVSRRMISKPCWAETWTWMRHRGEETGCRFWF